MVYNSDFSTLTENEILALQADIMSASTGTDSNPYIAGIHKKSVPAKKYSLINTKYPALGPAVNALAISQDNLTSATASSLDNIYQALGDIASSNDLVNKLAAYSSETFAGTDAKVVINILMDIDTRLKNIEKLVSEDYEDCFDVEDDVRTDFTLTRKPLGSIRMYVNGIRYFSGRDFTYNAETLGVTWTNTEFSIKNSTVVFIYKTL